MLAASTAILCAVSTAYWTLAPRMPTGVALRAPRQLIAPACSALRGRGGATALGSSRAGRVRAAAPAVEQAEAVSDAPEVVSMDELVSLCKRRGFIFPSSEVYGGFAGFYDYGPLGVELRNNIKRAWWKDFVHKREDMVGLDSSIIGSPQIWKASGHIDGSFSDGGGALRLRTARLHTPCRE